MEIDIKSKRRERLVTYVNEEQKEALKQIAKEKNTSISGILEALTTGYLKSLSGE